MTIWKIGSEHMGPRNRGNSSPALRRRAGANRSRPLCRGTRRVEDDRRHGGVRLGKDQCRTPDRRTDGLDVRRGRRPASGDESAQDGRGHAVDRRGPPALAGPDCRGDAAGRPGRQLDGGRLLRASPDLPRPATRLRRRCAIRASDRRTRAAPGPNGAA